MTDFLKISVTSTTTKNTAVAVILLLFLITAAVIPYGQNHLRSTAEAGTEEREIDEEDEDG